MSRKYICFLYVDHCSDVISATFKRNYKGSNRHVYILVNQLKKFSVNWNVATLFRNSAVIHIHDFNLNFKRETVLNLYIISFESLQDCVAYSCQTIFHILCQLCHHGLEHFVLKSQHVYRI